MAKILLIEDDQAFNSTLENYLEYIGNDVTCAFNGQQGLSLMENDLPDLLITDIIMPDMDGIKLLFELRNDSGEFPCKVVVMSGGGRMGGNDYLKMAAALDVDAILEKPFGMAELQQKITPLLTQP